MERGNLDKDFAVTVDQLEEYAKLKHMRFYHQRFVDYLKSNISTVGDILDIGERNPLIIKIENEFNIKIDSTLGDLDELFKTPKEKYDIIICSQVLEHVFNPLWMLERIKLLMEKHTLLILSTPIKPNWITSCKGHFHEFDIYRFKKLIQRAELKIGNFKHYHMYGRFTWRLLTGIRPFLYIFQRRNATCILKKIQ